MPPARARVAPPPLLAPSAHQRAVFEFVERAAGHAVVMATAGSGKTTTLVEVARRLPPGTRACFLAFNRSTAAELHLRLPRTVEATTIHALGRAALVPRLPAVATGPVDSGKYLRLARALLRGASGAGPPPGADPDRLPDLAAYLSRLAGFARLELTDPEDEAALLALEGRYGLECPVGGGSGAEALRALLGPLLTAGAEAAAAGSVDFTDLVHLPLTLRLPLPRHDFVCVDEAQDLSRLTLALVLGLVEAGARALFVGDPRQAIYAFAGADRSSLERVRAATGAAVLPLSVSYRCPTRHVALARRFAPEMTPAAGAPLGSVRLLPLARLARSARPGDLVVARTNAPLVGVALALARAGRAARVLGEDLVPTLLELAQRVFRGSASLPATALTAVREHARAEQRRLELAFMTSQRLAALLKRSADAHEALGILVEAVLAEAPSTPEAALAELWRGRVAPFSRLAELATALLEPKDTGSGVIVTTIHKAKGREAARVFLLHPEEAGVGSGDERDDQAEANVLFVALTRAKRELVLVERWPGAVAARLAEHSRRPPLSSLTRDWDEVLRLALVMAGGRARGARAWSRRERTRGPPRRFRPPSAWGA